jgi:hypothetical protein
MLIKKKDQVIGDVTEIGGAFQATWTNWSTGECKYIGTFETFQAAKKAIQAHK